MSLRLRLALWTALTTLVLVSSGGWLFAHLLHREVDQALSEGLAQRSALLGDAIETTSGAIHLPGPQRTGVLPPAEGLMQVLSTTGRVLAASPTLERPLLDPAQIRAASRHPIQFIAPLGLGADPTQVLAAPVTTASHVRVITVVGTSIGVTAHAVHTVQLGVVAAVGPLVLLSALGSWVLAGAALGPVERMRRRAEVISAEDIDARLPIPPTREIAALARTFNELLGRLQGALVRERQLVADAGHELRTPLTALRGELELAMRPDRSRDDLRGAVKSAFGQTERIVRLAQDLLLLARSGQDPALLRRTSTDLPDLLEAELEATRARAAATCVSIVLRAQPVPPLAVDPDRIRQLVGNLLDNALRHAPASSVIDVGLRVDHGDCRRVWIDVADEGPGFPPDFLPEAFLRFHRADSARSRSNGGSGLGLAIVRALARAHGGDAVASNRPAGGAVVQVWLPAPGEG